uniref:Cadherin-like domain-containing protein n=1 Tax=Tetradesmus obliquus TaxID=3088 RepID=A0A383VCU5_TETOB|eukprot:jgi/Sobl393_1/13066/SZX62464.1
MCLSCNSSEPMQPPANHKPTPRNFTTTTLVDRYVTITVIAPELYWGLDPDSTDLPGLKLAGAGPAAKGGIVEIVQLTGNDTGIRYTPPTNFSGTDIFPYSLTDGLATATAYITVRVTSRPPSGGVTGVDPCGSVCDSKHIIVNNPNDTKAGQAGNSAVVYSGMTDGIAEVISSSRRMAAPQGKVSGIATSILKKIGMAIVQGIKGPKEDKATWLKYELEKDLSQMEDYLVCEMNSIVGNAFYAAGQQMQQQHVYDFNNAINGVQDYLMDGCGSRNCLNYTQLAPRLRNDASGMNCVIGHKSNGCSSVASWDYYDPVMCTWVDSTSGSGTGICDPVTKLCYESSVSFSGVIDYYAKTIIPTFLQHPAINYFHAFDQYDSVDAVSAVAKGAALYMVLLQELILLGSPGGENATMIAFAKRMADYLEPRYQYHTDEARLRNLVTSTSYTTGPMKFTNCNDGGCNNCPYVPDYWREHDCCTGWQCSTDMVTVGGVTMYTGNFRIRQGCSKNLVSVSCDYVAWGHDKNHNCYGTCARMADLSTGSCNRLWCNRTLPECAPESYYSNDCKCGQVDWWQGLDQGFRALRDDVTAQLANVTVIISAMRNISHTGLPMELFGLYQSSYYPLASCDLGNATSMRSGSTMQGSNTSTGSSSSSTATSDSTHTGGPEQLFGTARGVDSSNPGPAAAAAAAAASAAAPRADASAAAAAASAASG